MVQRPRGPAESRPAVSARARPSPRAISYDKFAKMMESSYRRTYKPGEAIFSQGDAVDGFYIVTHGECRVQVSARSGEAPKEITKLGPGDFFGETGLLEGRGTRNSSVICTTPVEVLMIDNAMVCACPLCPCPWRAYGSRARGARSMLPCP